MLLFKVILLTTIALFVLSYLACKYNWDDAILVFALSGGIIGLVIAFAVGLSIILTKSQGYVQGTIAEKTVEYNGLIRELELVEAGDESFDRSAVYKQVLAYNDDVTNYKKYAYTPWLTGLYSKEIADNLQLIDF